MIRSSLTMYIDFNVWKRHVLLQFVIRISPLKNSHLNYIHNLCERAKRASAQKHHIFSFLWNVRLWQIIMHFISQTVFFEEHKCLLTLLTLRYDFIFHCQLNTFGTISLSFPLFFPHHIIVVMIIINIMIFIIIFIVTFIC